MSLTGLLLPARCAGCGELGRSPCPACAATLRPAPQLGPPAGLDSLAALVRYDDVARPLVTAVKYRNARASIDGLAPALAALVADLVDDAAITWAPTTPARRRERGFDQAELLARAVARRLGVPVRSCLRRSVGPHQTGRSAHERILGPHFTVSGTVPARVLVVDDVCTTGATLAAAATALRSGGATTVLGLVVARTPSGRARR